MTNILDMKKIDYVKLAMQIYGLNKVIERNTAIMVRMNQRMTPYLVQGQQALNRLRILTNTCAHE